MLKIDRNLVEQAARGMGLDVGPQGLLFPVRLEAHTQPSWQIMLRYVLDSKRGGADRGDAGKTEAGVGVVARRRARRSRARRGVGRRRAGSRARR